MGGKIKKILYWPWFKIFIICAVLFWLLIQWGDFNVRMRDAYTNCREAGFTNESCKEGFSFPQVLF